MTTKQTCWAAALALPLVVGPVWCLVWYSTLSHWLGTLAGFVLLARLACAVTDFRRPPNLQLGDLFGIPVGAGD